MIKGPIRGVRGYKRSHMEPVHPQALGSPLVPFTFFSVLGSLRVTRPAQGALIILWLLGY